MENIESASDQEVIVLVTVEVKPEKIEEFERVFGTVILKARQETGVLAYNTYKNQTKANHYVIVERYANKAVLDNHLSQDYFKELQLMLADALITPLSEAISFANEFMPA